MAPHPQGFVLHGLGRREAVDVQGFWLGDRQWRRLEPLLPNKPRGVPRVDGRRVVSGIVHVLRSGRR